MQITKIHILNDRVSIEWRKPFSKGDDIAYDEYALKCSEPAVPELNMTLQSLKADILEICELADGYENGIRVTGVSITHNDDIWGVVISAVKTLKKAKVPFNIHTPFRSAVADTADAGRLNCLSLDCVTRLERLMGLAEGYVNGDRAQGKIFNEPEDAESKRRPRRGPSLHRAGANN